MGINYRITKYIHIHTLLQTPKNTMLIQTPMHSKNYIHLYRTVSFIVADKTSIINVARKNDH